jgi:3-deoxy-D-manno-octulosonate 8-phosphate phosphatase (KDO 8-P phosphatase)
MIDGEIERRLRQVRMLALDVDGVLTDGGIYIFEDGTEFRRFEIKDGLGLMRLRRAGIQVAIISTSAVRSILHRARQLGISEVHLEAWEKLPVLLEICNRLGISLEQVAYIGDDLMDLPLLERVGLPCAPADAMDSVKAKAKLVTKHAGGHGAVRELCELLLEHVQPHTMDGEEDIRP